MTGLTAHLASSPIFHQGHQTGRVDLVGPQQDPDRILARILGSAYLRYREMWRAAENFEIRPDWPLHLDIDTNYTCNLRCIMCPLGVGGFPAVYENKWLDFALYRRVISEGAEKGLASIRLGLTGEPLLRPDIIDFVRLAQDLDLVDIMLITNGLLLTEDLGRKLIQAGLTRLMVSLDAVRPETYRRIRRGGDLAQVATNLRAFLKIRRELGADLPLLRVSFIRMSLNESEQEEFHRVWSDQADYISFQEYTNILESPRTDYFPAQRREVESFRCSDPWQRMSLFVNGDLFPCCSDFGRLAPVGNAWKDPVGRAWLSAESESLRRIHREGRWRENPVCRRCAANSTAAGD